MNVIEKFKNLSPVAKASTAYMFANLMLKGLSMISGPIFTRIMPTEQYGIVTTFMSWQSMLGAIVTLNLASGVFNNGMVEFKEDRSCFQLSLSVVSGCSAILFMLIYQLFYDSLTRFFDMPSILIYMLGLYYFFVPVYNYWSGRQRYEYKYVLLSVLTVGIAVLGLAISVIAVIAAPDEGKAVARIIGSDIPYILVGAFFLVYIAIKAKFKVKFQYMIYALKFNIPLVPHYLSMFVLSGSDRVMITKLAGAAYTAIYGVSYTVGMIINVIWTSVESAIAPWIYEKLNAGDEKSVRKRTFQILVVFAVLCNACALFAPEIIAILAPKQYYEGVYIIPSIAASAYFIAAYSMYMRVELYYKQTLFATICTSVAAITNLLLNWIFIRLFGYIAAGYTTLICYILLFLLHSLNVHRRGYASALDSKKIWCLSGFVVVCSCVMNLLYPYTLVRYCIIAVMAILLFRKRKHILAVIKIK